MSINLQGWDASCDFLMYTQSVEYVEKSCSLVNKVVLISLLVCRKIYTRLDGWLWTSCGDCKVVWSDSRVRENCAAIFGVGARMGFVTTAHFVRVCHM